MKWTTATALFLALSAGGAGVAVVLNREVRTPSDILAEIGQDMLRPSFDQPRALDRLESLLDSDATRADPALHAQLLRTRADLYRDLKVFSDARADVSTLLATYRPGDRTLRLEVAELRELDGFPSEALKEVQGIVNDHPDYSEARALAGRLEEAAARLQLQKANAVVARSLAQVDASKARDILRELTSRHVDDPAREILVKQLRDLFSAAAGSDLDEALRLVNAPRAGFGRARTAFAKAVTSSRTAEVVTSLAASFERAGQLGLAIDLQASARQIDSLRDDPAVFAATLDDLLAAKRLPEARQALLQWDWRLGGTLDFFRSAGTVFYLAGEYDTLNSVSEGLEKLGGDVGAHWALFFGSIKRIKIADKLTAEQKSTQINSAIASLRTFTTNTGAHPEPFFGAENEAHFLIAEGHRALGNTNNERVLLRAALLRDPDHSAEDWERLAATLRTSERSVNWTEVERALSHALNLAPERTASLAPLWFDAGVRALEKQGVTLENVIDEATRAGAWIPLRPVGPSVLTQIATSHLANGHVDGALRAARTAREDFRGLVPPLDVIIAAELSEPRKFSPEREIIERIESAGMDATVEGFMVRLPAGRLKGTELVRAILAAPARFGKAAVAAHYEASGDLDRAIDALSGSGPGSTPTALRARRAQLLLDREEWQLALAEIQRIEATSEDRTGTALLRLRATIGLGGGQPLEKTFGVILDEAPIGDPRLFEAIDLLASHGRADLAIQLVNKMDRRPSARTPAFYRRRVLIDVLASPTSASASPRESVLRAEAYLEDGTPEIGAILLAVTERDWRALPDLVERLSSSKFRPTPYQTVALDLLGERLERGARAAADGATKAPHDAHWAFLRAAASAMSNGDVDVSEWCGPEAARDARALLRGRNPRQPQDPRDALALYLVSSNESWSSWVMPRLAELTKATGSKVWSRWLEALVREARGEFEQRTKLIRDLTRMSPRFGPAHDLALRDAERKHPTEPLHPDVVRTRRVRLTSLGEDLIADPIEIALAKAGDLARKGDYVAAATALQPVVRSDDPRDSEGRLMLGIFMLRADQPSLAAEHLNEAALGEPGVYREIVVDSLLYAIEHALETVSSGKPQRGALTRDRSIAMLSGLARRYPLDPRVALAQLELLVVGEGERGVRARGALERLFRDSGGKTLDQLRRGSTRSWVEFLLPIAPGVALELVERDLALEPGNLDLWQLGGQVAEARGETDLARRYYETLMEIDPRPRTGYALAALMIDNGDSLRDVNPILNRASRAQGGGSAREQYLRKVAQLRQAPRNNPRVQVLDDVIDGLASLWTSRARNGAEVDPLELGLLYVDALFRRSDVPDMRTLSRVLGELEPLAKGTLYEGQLVEALQGVVQLLSKQVVAAKAPATPTGKTAGKGANATGNAATGSQEAGSSKAQD